MESTPVSLIIMLITLAASAAGFWVADFAESNVFHPYSVARGRRLYTLITGNLIHADFGHLAFNMFSFYMFGVLLEPIIGSDNFLIVYIGSMFIADIPSLVMHRNNPEYRTLGASGAVSGIVFASILFNPTMRIGMMFFPPIIPAYVFGPLYLLYCYYASRNLNDNINHDAHLWGALGGIAVTITVIPASVDVFLSSMGWK